jgi:cytochrome c553
MLLLIVMAGAYSAVSQTPLNTSAQNADGNSSSDLAKSLGISFSSDSSSSVVVTKDGRQYLVDVGTRTIKEIHSQPSGLLQTESNTGGESKALFSKNCAACHGPDGKGIKSIGTPDFTDPAFQQSVSDTVLETAIEKGKGGIMPAWAGKLTHDQISGLVKYIRSLAPGASNGAPPSSSQSSTVASSTGQTPPKPKIYQPGDDFLVSLPTGRPTDRHGVYVNFTHRFPFQPAFSGPNEGATLFGLDNVAIASLGFRYGVTDRLSVSVYRSPSFIDRPIQLMAGYNILEEEKGNPFNLMVRASIDGQDNFRKNYTENLEVILSRSITSRAQFYLVPTASFNDRRLEQPSGFLSSQIPDVPGVNAFSLGVGLAIDIRPSVALLAEVIPTLVNAHELGIFRPAFSFGIQKKLWRHAFTLGLTNSPGTTVSQRAGTLAQYLNKPNADTFPGLALAFDLTRQIK